MSAWAIDLGNSNTGVARWDAAAGEARLLELEEICRSPGGGEPLEAPRLVPSATHVLEDPHWLTWVGRWPLIRGRWFLGQEALIGRGAIEKNSLIAHPSFVPAFKPYLGRETMRPLARVGNRTLTAREVARLFVRELLAAVHRHSGERINDVVFTTPVEAYESYRAELLAIGRSFNISRIRFIDEPVAAVLGYGLSLASERLVLVVDFGGGTFHMALVRISAKGAAEGSATVLAKAGRGVGGNLIDEWLLADLCAKAGYNIEGQSEDDEVQFWHRLMLAEARRIKEALFFESPVGFRLVPPKHLRRAASPGGEPPILIEVAREDLVELLERHGVYRMVEQCLDSILEQSAAQGVDEQDIDDVIMVGGSTLLPEIYPALEGRFGRDRVRAWQPFEAVAYGACAFAADSFMPSDFIVHDYAIRTYDPKTHESEYTTVIPRGTRFPTRPDFWRRQLVPTCSLGEPETMFKLVVCEIGRADGRDRRFVWDADGRVQKVGGAGPGARDKIVVPLNDASPTLGTLDPAHSPSDRRPRLEILFGVNADRWLIATVIDLKTAKTLMKETPVVRLM